MTIEKWLKHATRKLEAANITTARLDALILLEDVTQKDRALLLANGDEVLSVESLSRLQKQLVRRANHEPLAYIRGKAEFFGREFKVTPATLQPRPETETMIELLKNIPDYNPPNMKARPSYLEQNVVVVDVGTGSGCLAITAQLEWPGPKVYATEINKDALVVAKQNAKKLGADVTFYQGNLLQPLLNLRSAFRAPSIVMANLPYVPDSHTINKAAMQEPPVAIFGGPDGLDLYRELFAQLAITEDRGLIAEYALTESLPFQHDKLAQIALAAGYNLIQTEGFIQIFTAA